MTHEEIAETLYDELQHNKLTYYTAYSERLYELLDQAHPNDKLVGDHVEAVENILHNKYSFGFCDMCEEVIFYDDDTWYDTQCATPEEQDILEKTIPKYEEELGCAIQDVCPACWHKLLKEGEAMLECDNCRAKIKPTPDFHCPNCGEKIGD